MTGFDSKRQMAQDKVAQPSQEPPSEWAGIKAILDEYGLQAIDFVADWKAVQEPVASEYIGLPVAYQYAYPDGTWRFSFGEEINGCKPIASRAVYARKDGK